MKAEEAVTPLLDIFKDNLSFLRDKAGEALKKIGSNSMISPLTTIILDPDSRVERKQKAVSILASIPSEKAVEVLVGLLRDHRDIDEMVRVEMISAFQTRKSVSAVPVLIDILKELKISDNIHTAVVKTLQAIGVDTTTAAVASNSVIDHLMSMLKDKTLADEIRLRAAAVLTHIPSQEARQALDDAFTDSSNSDELRVGIAKLATMPDSPVKDFTARKNVFKTLEGIYFRSASTPDFQTNIVNLLFGRGIKPESVARFFNINIKLARYLVKDSQKEQRRRILEDRGFREQLNEISYNLNREQTLHPAERRVGEDEKTNLFDYLFSLPDITEAKAVFDTYFRNDPQSYAIDIPHLQTLLGYVSIDQIKTIIRTVVEDPKQSLDEIMTSVKGNLQGQPNADNIVRELSWILSNLFALQDRIERLEPLRKILEENGKSTQDLIQVLGEIDRAQNFNALHAIAVANGFAVNDVLSFKLESVSLLKREDILADAFHSLRALPEEEAAAIYPELVGHFEVQPPESKRRMYFKLLFIQDTNNANILTTIIELRNGNPLSARNISVLVKQFLSEYRAILTEDGIFIGYVDALTEPKNDPDRKEAFKQLRRLYQDRAFSSKKLKEGYLRNSLGGLAEEISLPQATPQIPQVFYGPLLRIGSSNQSLETLRVLVTAMNNNPAMHDQLARLKTDLYDKFVTMAALNDYTERGAVVDSILRQLIGQHDQPSVENSAEFYNRLIYYLEQYTKGMDTFIKANRNSFVDIINDRLKEVSSFLLNDLINNSRLNDGKIGELQEMLAGLKSEELIAAFRRRMEIEDVEAALSKLKTYAATNPRFRWRDHQGRNIYELIGIFLRTIDEPEIYKNIWDALMAEVDGRFVEWRYQSQDYLATIDEIIKIEMAKLEKEDQKKLKTALEAVEGKTLYERLQGIEGFDELKAKITKVKTWEKTFSQSIDEDLTGEFTNDFYTLFNIGNYQGSTSCQSCTYGSKLNQGLTGYTVNGANKAIALLDKDRRVTATRRIVRLRIFEDASGNKFPGIFVEEKATQFGVRHIDKLYEILDQVSEATGLPILGSVDKEAQDEAVQKGEVKEVSVVLVRGRSSFDYSDTYGAYPQIGMGLLNQQSEDRLKTPLLNVRQRPMAADATALGTETIRSHPAAREQKDEASLPPASPLALRGEGEALTDLQDKSGRASVGEIPDAQTPGGIDVRKTDAVLKTKGEGVSFPKSFIGNPDDNFDPNSLPGLTPIIFQMNIIPIQNLPAMFLGISEEEQKEDLSMVK